MNRYLLPYQWKLPGWTFVAVGTVLAVCYFWFNIRIILPTFAVISYYLEQKSLVTFKTNVADEIILLSLILGFLLIVFSRDKPGSSSNPRIKEVALFRAVFYNSLLMLFSVLFTYGQAFFGMLLLNLVSVFIFYLIFYHFLKRKITSNGPVVGKD